MKKTLIVILLILAALPAFSSGYVSEKISVPLDWTSGSLQTYIGSSIAGSHYFNERVGLTYAVSTYYPMNNATSNVNIFRAVVASALIGGSYRYGFSEAFALNIDLGPYYSYQSSSKSLALGIGLSAGLSFNPIKHLILRAGADFQLPVYRKIGGTRQAFKFKGSVAPFVAVGFSY